MKASLSLINRNGIAKTFSEAPCIGTQVSYTNEVKSYGFFVLKANKELRPRSNTAIIVHGSLFL
jgi:hypothetical protein